MLLLNPILARGGSIVRFTTTLPCKLDLLHSRTITIEHTVHPTVLPETADEEHRPFRGVAHCLLRPPPSLLDTNPAILVSGDGETPLNSRSWIQVDCEPELIWTGVPHFKHHFVSQGMSFQVGFPSCFYKYRHLDYALLDVRVKYKQSFGSRTIA